MKSIQLTVVIDNQSHRVEAPGEHGLCMHIRSGEQTLLFDTGRSDLVWSNINALGLTTPAPSLIALSHGHYDHTTGTAILLAHYPQTQLHLQDSLLEPKWILDADQQWRYGGVPTSFRKLLETHTYDSHPGELIPDIYSSGSVVGVHARNAANSRFFRNARGHTIVDTFPDEQFLMTQSDLGVSLLSGCMHAGMEATLRKARELFPASPFYALVGGLHLESKSQEYFAEILAMLRSHGFQKVMPLHCTGQGFVDYLAMHAPELLVPGCVGATMTL